MFGHNLDVKGLKVPPSPGYYDRPSKVGQVKDDVKGVKTIPVVQQQQHQVQDEIKGIQQRDQVKGQVPVVPQYPVKGVQQKDPVKGISQHPIKSQQPVVQQRRPYPVKGHSQQRDDDVKGGKSLVQQAEVKGAPRQRPHYPVKGYPQQPQQKVQDDVQQRQQPVFPVKGQRQTRSLKYEQDFDYKVGTKGKKFKLLSFSQLIDIEKTPQLSNCFTLIILQAEKEVRAVNLFKMLKLSSKRPKLPMSKSSQWNRSKLPKNLFPLYKYLKKK